MGGFTKGVGMKHRLMARLAWYRLFSLVVMLLFSTLSFAFKAGDTAPPFKGKLVNHRPISLKKLENQWVILGFWASWCPYCLEELPDLNRYYQKHKKDKLNIVMISIDDPEDEAEAKRVMRAYRLPWAFAREMNVKGYGKIARTPTYFIISPQGKIVKDSTQGEPINLDSETLEEEITPLLK
jgi:peroxiredoxin